jgi:5'-deoxynucleotidase YfbR-like HD superfamily hydrolase
MTEFVERRLRSGQTMRYHTVPAIGQQSVAAHSWRACVLMHTLWPDHVTLQAFHWMLYHDSAEQELGDMPAPAKWNWPILYDYYTQHEWSVEESLGIEGHYDNMSPNEQAITSIADMLECVDYIAHCIMRGNHSFEAREIYWNGRKHLLKKYGEHPLFGEARKYMEHLHAQVVQICPLAAAHVG